jgi:hypothetical protein
MHSLPPVTSSLAASPWRFKLLGLGQKIRSALRTLTGRPPGVDRGLAPSQRITDVPPASVDDVVKTLATPRFRIFGFGFGGTQKVSDLQLWTDASGRGFGATALVDGRPVVIKGDLLARLVDRQFAQLQQKKRAQASQEASLPKPAPPKAAKKSSSPVAPQAASTVSPDEPALLSPALSASSQSSDASMLPALLFEDQASAGTLTPASSVGDLQKPASQLTEPMAAYVQEAMKPSYYATLAEVIATAQSLQTNIRIITRNMEKDDPTKLCSFGVRDIVGNPAVGAPYHTVVLSTAGAHYEPVSPAINDEAHQALLSKDALNTDATAEQLAAADQALRSLTGGVPGDGSCFFYAIATLVLADDPRTVDTQTRKEVLDLAKPLRKGAVDFIKNHGETFVAPLFDDYTMTLWQLALDQI